MTMAVAGDTGGRSALFVRIPPDSIAFNRRRPPDYRFEI
jgi:hypothetical protein